MKLNSKIIKAMSEAKLTDRQIKDVVLALMPKPKKFSSEMVARIEKMVFESGVAIVTKRRVFSQAGYHVRKNNTAAMLKARYIAKHEKAPVHV